jgi:hypothetical protein
MVIGKTRRIAAVCAAFALADPDDGRMRRLALSTN